MTTRNFDALFAPRSIALVGASNEPHTVGSVVARNLLSAGFSGPVMPVNAHHRQILGRPCYPSIAALPQVPDLAVIVTPAPSVPGIVKELAEAGCRAAVVISAGLGEVLGGKTLRQHVLDAARPHLMRIVGPNCLGLISTPAGINASFAHLTPKAGDIALVSQSGAIVTAVLDWADARGIGFSHVVSLGDMGDADFGDLLDFLSTDRATRSILLYVENVTFAKKFMSAARIAARAKPVLVIKSGRSADGARAALSHTGALAGSDIVYDAAFKRAGVLRVNTIEELFEAAATLATGVRIRGERLTILTNGGGAGVLAVDALDAHGGHLAAMSEATRSALDAVLPPIWSRGNPVDIIGDATGERYGAALDILMADRDSDAVLVLNCPTAVADGMEAGRAVANAHKRQRRIPVLTSWLGGSAAAPVRSFFSQEKIPTFESPDDAIRAFTQLVEYRRNQELLLETPSAGVTIAPAAVAEARQILQKAAGEGRASLSEWEAKAVLALFGIPIVPTVFVTSAEAAADEFSAIGGPAVLKVVSPQVVHKSDVGGVRLNIGSGAEMGEAVAVMTRDMSAALPDAEIAGFTVQPMVTRPDAQELIAGIARDATFGPVILFGQGGKATEVIGDRAIGLPPLNSVLARRMVEDTAVSRLLSGFRDVPAVPMEALTDVLVRLAELSVLLPEVGELDINPLLADGEGVIALDARIALAEPGAKQTGPAIRPYPGELGKVVTLRDETRFLLRPIRPEDENALAEMVLKCTPDDLRLRFMGLIKALPHQTAARFSQIDYDREMAFVAVEPQSGHGEGPIYGVVRLVADPENETAEFAVLVRSDMKGKGLGYRLMTAILGYGRKRGLKRISGEVLQENSTMLKMARDLGFHSAASADQDVAHIIIELDRLPDEG
ncbi:bifunctional acetate--CoA ligase family protein/GNAT family N-acetyltransferase [Jiella mangrovi]|uniref:Bifunctional acetate--CoA ligase family protein/GNAT family N-acetyltransferase n=1 Tax=Jiella mangrovi TaxID=2821407 RepID=A0ABS4BJG0_9HYPH|nr:bifunctional acetate--CoA ligase family protein/GNAT family N-acetyltransferase [Jiella mangrovi]MBP0616886.1 bifunctional acetate--CoA ligase family protein/GNAT family N-acetyltransferase [Jiella mangrovi]